MEGNEKKNYMLAAQLTAVADQTRLDILALLVNASGPLSVGHMVNTTHYGQSKVSRHLQRLQRAGLVCKEGREYRAEAKPVEDIFAEALEYVGGHEASPT